jgi:hypothetical protein
VLAVPVDESGIIGRRGGEDCLECQLLVLMRRMAAIGAESMFSGFIDAFDEVKGWLEV